MTPLKRAESIVLMMSPHLYLTWILALTCPSTYKQTAFSSPATSLQLSPTHQHIKHCLCVCVCVRVCSLFALQAFASSWTLATAYHRERSWDPWVFTAKNTLATHTHTHTHSLYRVAPCSEVVIKISSQYDWSVVDFAHGTASATLTWI